MNGLYLCVQQKSNALFGSLWSLLKVSQSCRMLQLGVERVFPVSRYVWTILGGKILYKCDESSPTVACLLASRSSEKYP